MTDSSFQIQLIATLLKILLMIVIALQVSPIMTWVERRQMALIQRRVGPNRVGIFGFRLLGLGQPIADALKLVFKEDFVPRHVHRFFYLSAPIISATIAIIAVTGIPLGRHVMVGGEVINLQAVSLNAGFLFLFAMSAVGVFGVALAGWSSNNKYALLGGLRASAQMISYEIAMGMSIVPLVFLYGELDLQRIIEWQTYAVNAQGVVENKLFLGFLPNWGVFYAPLSFVIFLITVFAETNRLPFDLAEGEAELVAGFLTEYGAMRWSLFFLGEYTMMFTLSALMVCLFFGGYEIPYLPQAKIVEMLSSGDAALVTQNVALWIAAALGLGVLIVKICFFLFLFVQVRFTIPRFRYDQLMRIGWYYLLPIALANLVVMALVTALIRF